jgi:2-polyprenyl-6-methoxyphenol hydroxylase-like FAD-dependent oxidoreductase
MMANVLHPAVDRPLVANTDGSGHLVKKDSNETDFSLNNDTGKVPLSEVSVGHLAQHTFCKILYDAVLEAEEKKTTKTSAGHSNKSENKILYGHIVTDCMWDDVDQTWTVETDQEMRFQSNIIVAADGARSYLCSQVLNIPMNGQLEIQNLMNVHFQVTPTIEQKIP